MLKLYISDIVFFEREKEYYGFSEYRKAKLKKIRDELHFMQSASAEALLCHAARLAGLALPLDIKLGSGGKPYTEGINFSISHSQNKVLLALSDIDTGADIQKINPAQNLAAARKFLTEDERNGLDVNKFFRLFTMKESYFKMTGEGLPFSPVPLSSFKKCFFNTFRHEDYMISVCSPEPFNATAEFVDLKSIIQNSSNKY